MTSSQVPEPYGNRSVQFAEALPPHPDSDTFDFRTTLMGLLESCRVHRLLILVTCLLTIAITAAYIVIWPPVFVADVTVVAESDKDTSRDDFYQYWHLFRKGRVANEVQLFTAPTVLVTVIDRLNLKYDDVYHSFFSHASYLWQQSWPGRNYRRLKEMVFPRKRGPYDPTPEQVDRGRTVVDFKSGVSLEPVSDTDVGKLVVRGPSPRVAEMANMITQVYLEQRLERQRAEADMAYNALAVETATAKAEVLAAESQTEQFDTENSLLLTMEKDKLDVTQWEVLQNGIADITAALAGETSTLAEINRQLAIEEKDVVSARLMKLSPIKESLTDKLSQLELARRQTLIHYRPDAPEVRDIDQQIEVVKQQMAREPSSQVAQTTVMRSDGYEGLRRRKAQLEADMAGQRAALVEKRIEFQRLTGVVNDIPRKMKVSRQMERERQLLEKRYVILQEKLMVAAVSRAMASSAPATIQIVEPAVAPDEPAWPKTKLLLGGATLLGLLAGVGLALLIDLVSDRVDRHRLAGGAGGLQIYAILRADNRFAAQLFPLPDRHGRDVS